MYQLVETQDSRIAQYSFGKSISQYGMTVFSCNSARKGKKIFGNDPDPTTEIMVQTQDDIISAHIKDNPNLGQNGGDSPGGGTPGSSGTAIDGWSYRVGQSGNNDGDIRGPKNN